MEKGLTLEQLQGMGAKPAQPQGMTLQQVLAQAHPEAPAPQDSVLNNPVTRGVQAIFPGKQVGQAIGTLAGLGVTKAKEALGIVPKGTTSQYDTSAPSPLQVTGDVVQGALTVASPGVGTGESVAGRIGANSALGAGLGGTNAIAEGKDLGGVAKSTAIGGALGGGISAATEGASYLAKNLPVWFTKMAFPKLTANSTKNPEELVNYALENSDGLTLKKMYDHSKKAVGSYESQVQSVLSHPDYAEETGKIAEAIPSVQKSLPNAQLDENKIIGILKQVAPQNKSIVDKVANGTANIEEQNILRKELDFATKKAYGDKPTLTFAKGIGKNMADFLRTNVKTAAPETVPIFDGYSKELALNSSLKNALNKKRVAGPLVAGSAGFAGGGIKGAIEAIAVEEGIRSPTARLLAGKIIKNVAPKIGAVATPAIQGLKAPLIKGVTK